MRVLIITGTDTGIGKTVVAAALAVLAREAGQTVAYLKAAQTGVPGEEADVDVVRRLAGDIDIAEGARFPDALSPQAAARAAGRPPVDLTEVAEVAARLAASHDLVVVEGAGGLLVRYDDEGRTVTDLAGRLDCPVLVVTAAGLGTLNATALTVEALARRGLRLDGLVLGSWPCRPSLAERSNLVDLPAVTGQPLAGALCAGAGQLAPERFPLAARSGLAPRYGGSFDPGQLCDHQHERTRGDQ